MTARPSVELGEALRAVIELRQKGNTSEDDRRLERIEEVIRYMLRCITDEVVDGRGYN